MIFASGAVVHAFSKSQTATALSTFEAELCALCLTVRRLLALRRLASFILDATLPPSPVYTDSKAALAHLANGLPNNRTRHIAVNTAFFCDAADSGEIALVYVRSEDNVADILAGAEDTAWFWRNVRRMANLPPQDA